MAQTDRRYVDDVTVWSIDGTDFLARLKDATITDEIDTAENSAILDPVEYPKKRKRRIRVEFDEAVEGSAALTPGDSYTVIVSDSTVTYTGAAILLSRSARLGEDGISRSFAFQYQGLPTIS